MESISKWKTIEGFDLRDKRVNLNEHPQKPHQAVLEGLKHSWIEDRKALKAHEKSLEFKDGPDQLEFINRCKAEDLFSDRKFFKTVFDQDKDQEIEKLKAAEKETFKNKVVVDNTHFKVNTRNNIKTLQRRKYNDICEDPVKKYGYKLSDAVVKKMNQR